MIRKENAQVYHKVCQDAGQITFETAIQRHSGDKTICYKLVQGERLLLSYYYPPGFDSLRKYPAIFFVHGGAWSSRQIFQDQDGCWQGDYLGYLARYFSDKGFVCISIDYRLARQQGQADRYQLIDLYEDCADAVQYGIDHAAEHGIDPASVFVLGESAGGHLAGALATFPYYRRFQFRGVILVNPITDFVYDADWRGYIPLQSSHPQIKDKTIEERCAFLSPLYHLSQETCPLVLLHGAQDQIVSPGHSQRVFTRMLSLGRSCQLHILEGTDHAFLLAEYTDNRPACALGVKIIQDAIDSLL